VLSEAAFISNPAQARQLQDKAFIEAIARAHVEALRQELVR
jgi:N-acetylmuramoyl-L-alanine amidase